MAAAYHIPNHLAQAIEDAILIGHIGELDAVLMQIGEEWGFPKELRAGIEALRHFRAYYGKGGVSAPQDEMQKKKTALMEAAWGAELLDMIKHNEGTIARRA